MKGVIRGELRVRCGCGRVNEMVFPKLKDGAEIHPAGWRPCCQCGRWLGVKFEIAIGKKEG
jgi:hypothetical protein